MKWGSSSAAAVQCLIRSPTLHHQQLLFDLIKHFTASHLHNTHSQNETPRPSLPRPARWARVHHLLPACLLTLVCCLSRTQSPLVDSGDSVRQTDTGWLWIQMDSIVRETTSLEQRRCLSVFVCVRQVPHHGCCFVVPLALIAPLQSKRRRKKGKKGQNRRAVGAAGDPHWDPHTH